jgi:hypothetical protein
MPSCLLGTMSLPSTGDDDGKSYTRPHQGIGQQLPVVCEVARPTQHAADKVIAIPILGGLHHDYRKVA